MLGTKEKEIIVVILVLAVVVAGAGLFFGGYFDGKIGNDVNEPVGLDTEDGTFEDLPALEVQANFPADFPFEDGAGITNNYKYNVGGSESSQYTIEYESNLTVAENLVLFEEYLTSNNYVISNRMSEENIAFLYGDGPTGDLSILIEAKRGTVVISASYLRQ